MSLNAYESAVNSEDEFERERLLREHIKALKNHIDDLHRKNYSNLIGMRSPNFVLMFIAVEPAYIEALKLDPSLFNYGYEKNVIMVSHTTLMPILRTVANLWRIERGQRRSERNRRKSGGNLQPDLPGGRTFKQTGEYPFHCEQSIQQHRHRPLVGQQGLVGKWNALKTCQRKLTRACQTLNYSIMTWT